MSGRVLGDASVVLTNPDTGKREQFLPGSELPAWAADLVGDHVYADAATGEDQDGPPPQSGKGSGKEAWVAYAEALGVDVTNAETRDDIIAVVAVAGHPVE